MLLSVVGLVSLYTFRERVQEPPTGTMTLTITDHPAAALGKPVQ
jgi:hypothetical protein